MLPDITISTLDLKRIDLLLDALPPSENFDTDALIEELSRATVVEPWQIPPHTVTMNSTVRFTVDGVEGELSRTLVYPTHSLPDEQHLSVLTPVGGALLGLAEGDSMRWMQRDGRAPRVTVLEVLYQPEQHGDLHL